MITGIYIAIAVLIFLGGISRGFIVALIGAVLWPVAVIYVLVMFIYNVIKYQNKYYYNEKLTKKLKELHIEGLSAMVDNDDFIDNYLPSDLVEHTPVEDETELVLHNNIAILRSEHDYERTLEAIVRFSRDYKIKHEKGKGYCFTRRDEPLRNDGYL